MVPSLKTLKRLLFIQPIKRTVKQKNQTVIFILPNFSKIHEELLRDQICTYFSTFFPQYQCGFRKGCSAQHCLLAMT